MLTESQKDFYRKNGFLHIEQFFDPARCEALARDADAAAGDRFTVRLDMHKRPDFHKLHTDKRLLEVIDALHETRMIPIGSVFFYCKPGNPLENGSVWHQDNYAPKSPVGSYLVVGVPLDDADEENGSLIVVPGTHLLGDVPHVPKKNLEYDENGQVKYAYPIGDICEVPEGYAPVQLRYRRGDLLLMHGHTIHRAEKNPHPTRWRRTIYMHYIKDGHPFWPGWNARRELIERGD